MNGSITATLGHGTIRGHVLWSRDALFRPTIGVYLDGRLACIAPTFRRHVPRSGGVAVFEAALPRDALTKATDVLVHCFELGGSIDVGGGSRTTPTTWQYSLSQGSRQHAAEGGPDLFGGGFLDFLSLPMGDQIGMLYRDLLDRDPDPDGIRSRVTAIGSGTRDILEIRDELIMSEEFMGRHRAAPDQPVGAWCTWPCLAAIGADLVRTEADGAGALSPGLSYLTAVSRSGSVAAHLSAMALGRAAAETERRPWDETTIGLLRGIEHRVTHKAQALKRLEALHPASRRALAGYDLMALCAPGESGVRVGPSICRAGLTDGDLVSGLHIPLVATRYRLDGQLAVFSGAGSLAMAASSEGIIFARTEVVLKQGINEIGLSFDIPHIAERLVASGLFGIEIVVQGAYEAQLTSLTLKAESAVPTLLYPAVDDWLPLVRVGPAARRQGPRCVVSDGSGRPGHLIFGPYTRLLPGSYILSVTIESADGEPFLPLRLDVVSASDRLLADTETIQARSAAPVQLRFDVSDEVSASGGIEFRVSSTHRKEFCITTISVVDARTLPSAALAGGEVTAGASRKAGPPAPGAAASLPNKVKQILGRYRRLDPRHMA